MPDYFVSTARGNDTTGAGTATNPWKTIGKAIGASPAITLPGSGTTRLYIEPGTYYETVTLGLSPTSGAPLEILGDVDGAGFLAGGYATPVRAIVEWCAWTDDSSVVLGTALTGNAASYVTLRNLEIYGGQTGSSGCCVHVTTGNNWTIQDCILIGHVAGASLVNVTTAAAGLNLTVERCDLHSCSGSTIPILRIAAPETASEYSLGSVVRNCRFFGGAGSGTRAVRLDRIASTSLGFLGTGLAVQSCSFFGVTGSCLLVYTGITITLASPVTIQGCLMVNCADGVNAGHTSQVAENYNLFHVVTPRVGVSAGANSNTAARPVLNREEGRTFGLSTARRPFGAPNDVAALKAAVGYSAPLYDRFGRPRSSPTAYGAVEAVDDAAATTNAGRLVNGGLVR